MRLTRKMLLSISVLTYCVRKRGRLVSLRQLARDCCTTADNMAHIVAQLRRRGWVETYRGRGGGLTLARNMEQLRLGDVVRSFRTGRRERTDVESQLVADILSGAEHHWLDYLNRFTIEDIVNGRAGALCLDGHSDAVAPPDLPTIRLSDTGEAARSEPVSGRPFVS